jgi:hypothetical protein
VKYERGVGGNPVPYTIVAFASRLTIIAIAKWEDNSSIRG